MIKSLPPLPEMVMKRDRAFQDKFRRAALMMVVSSDRQYLHTGRNAVGLAFESGAIIGILQMTVERSKYQSFSPPWFDVVRAMFDYATQLLDASPVDWTQKC